MTAYRLTTLPATSEALLRQTLAMARKARGPDHPDVAAELNRLAGTIAAQGRYAEAEPLIKRCLAIYEKEHGGDHFEVGQVLHDLAMIYARVGSSSRARTANPDCESYR